MSKSKKVLFPNLNAEQSRRSMSDEVLSARLGITRTTFNMKKKTGKFKLNEIMTLCHIFDTDFAYLFKLDEEALQNAKR